MRKENLGTLNIPSQNLLEIEHNGSVYALEIATTEDQLIEAKMLDDMAFGSHLGITMEELTEISNHGAVLLLRDGNGKLIGETQVITSPISQHPNIAPDEAYNYGTAVHPELQNHGIAQVLYKGQELIGIKAGKTRNTLTARLENAQSIRGRIKAGFHIVGYDPNHYGPINEGGARLILEKNHANKNQVFPSDSLIKMVSSGEVIIVDKDTITEALLNKPFIGIHVKIVDEIDFKAHQLICEVFSANNFIGIGLLKPNECRETSQESLLVLKHK